MRIQKLKMAEKNGPKDLLTSHWNTLVFGKPRHCPPLALRGDKGSGGIKNSFFLFLPEYSLYYSLLFSKRIIKKFEREVSKFEFPKNVLAPVRSNVCERPNVYISHFCLSCTFRLFHLSVPFPRPSFASRDSLRYQIKANDVI